MKRKFKNVYGVGNAILSSLGITKKFDYKSYWNSRYKKGEDSGTGSYGVLAEFKKRVINEFIKKHTIDSLIDFGCGDGNQIKDIACKSYVGFDVARSSIELCSSLFEKDATKSFFLYDPKYFVNHGFLRADLVMCLDALYHITDESDFRKTLADIFSCARSYVLLYTNVEVLPYSKNSHIVYRDTLSYLSAFDDFQVQEIIKQKYNDLSGADFIILKRK